MEQYESKRYCVQTKIKSSFGLAVLFAMLFIAGHAFAISPVPAGRIMEVQAPKGLQTTLEKQDGLLTITVDDAGSDWDKAIVYDGDLRAVELMAGVLPPSNAAGFSMENGLPFDTDEEAVDFFDSNQRNPYFQPTPLGFMQCLAPQMVAEYVPEKKLLSPISSDNMYIYVRWYDAQNTALETEKMRVVVKHAQLQSRYASPKMTGKENIVANADNQSHLSSETKDGEVTYTVASADAVTNPSRSILTKIKAPTGAVACNQVDLMMGSMPLTITNGYVELLSEYIENSQLPALKTGVWRENYPLEWLDASGNVIDCSMVTLYLNMLERDPWPCYVTSTSGVPWNAVPGERLHVAKGAALKDVQLLYQASSGILQYGYQSVLPSAAGMEKATVSIAVAPPEGAVTYSTVSSGGSGGLGRQGGASVYAQLMVQAKTVISSSMVSIWDYPVFEKIDAPDGKVSIYLSTLPDDPDECDVNVICWFDRSGQPISIEYYATLSGRFVMTAQTPVYESEASLPQQQAYPVAVEENGSLRDCRLVVTQYPQSGNNGLYYELRLEDELGRVIEPGRPVVLYLPYPQGHSYGQQEWAYQLQHYDLDFQRSTVVPLEQTPRGLRCETASFSPFVLGWTEAAAPAPQLPPKTGDSSEPAMWMIALIVSLLAMSGLALRRYQKRRG